MRQRSRKLRIHPVGRLLPSSRLRPRRWRSIDDTTIPFTISSRTATTMSPPPLRNFRTNQWSGNQDANAKRETNAVHVRLDDTQTKGRTGSSSCLDIERLPLFSSREVPTSLLPDRCASSPVAQRVLLFAPGLGKVLAYGRGRIPSLRTTQPSFGNPGLSCPSPSPATMRATANNSEP